RGMKVLGIDRFGVAHDQGSSHGETRIIRKAYFEHPDYVPLLLRAYDLWSELEAESQQQLFWRCGLMLAGLPNSEAISGARLSAQIHSLRIENLSATAASRRWPGFRVPDEFDVVFEPEAGFLKVEECVQSHLDCAISHGARLHLNDPVVSWSAMGGKVRVRTMNGEFVARSLVITAGAWSAGLMSDMNLPLQVLRKPTFWHKTTSANHSLTSGMPTFYFEMPDAKGGYARSFYGFPSIDGSTLKVAEHSGGNIVADPLFIDRECHDEDSEPVARFVQSCLPRLSQQATRHSVCFYTVTPDRHFVIDRHPQHSNVVIGCGFSGHGFKFTSVLGEVLADLATDRRVNLPIDFLSLKRLR
ncbi:MAG: N-methyl-L-tryptophan oxidase, partial [Planctomycetia bacterium]|nr:N-methyl-L-tryptophan oxidase [Planctomycetia bacterium]